MSEKQYTPPAWMFRDKKPPNDVAVFEVLTRVVFQGGLSWQLMDRKWPDFQRAFADFSIDEVANFDDDKLAELIEDASIIRNSQKIEATIYNAQEFVAIRKEFGSFLKYLNSLDKSNNYAAIIKEFSKRFKRFGPKSSYIFLYSIGEDIKREEEKHK
ncbi:MAG: DNA-3-methyladenine glycosylase I [Candidatus Heimdallarchaeota archaeon]